MPNLAQLNQCTACTACLTACPKGCITMAGDENGFRYPVVDEAACVGCGLCEKSCPVVTPPARSMNLPTAYAAYSRDEAVRQQSSSGGLFTEIARTVLTRGGSVYGAAYDENFRVVHIRVGDEASLGALRGAKYAQSDLGGSFADVKRRLDRGEQVLFSGTPCQVGGLKACLGKDYENLLTVDFVCHSVPSPMAWGKYVESLGDVRAISLRAKDTGWSRYGYCHRVETGDGIRLILSGESLYMKLFGGNYVSRESCANCRFKGYSRCSDLTIGDFWGIWDIAPEMDDNRGTSVVLCQSERGRELLEAIADRLVLKRVTLEEASHENGAMLRASPVHPKRQEALELIRSGRIAQCADWFKPPKPSLKQRIRALGGRLLRRLRK